MWRWFLDSLFTRCCFRCVWLPTEIFSIFEDNFSESFDKNSFWLVIWLTLTPPIWVGNHSIHIKIILEVTLPVVPNGFRGRVMAWWAELRVHASAVEVMWVDLMAYEVIHCFHCTSIITYCVVRFDLWSGVTLTPGITSSRQISRRWRGFMFI